MKQKKVDYERLGRLLHEVSEIGVDSQKKLYKVTFIKGIVGGFGGVIGATIVVAALLWIFSILGEVPLIGPFVDTLKSTITTNQENN